MSRLNIKAHWLSDLMGIKFLCLCIGHLVGELEFIHIAKCINKLFYIFFHFFCNMTRSYLVVPDLQVLNFNSFKKHCTYCKMEFVQRNIQIRKKGMYDIMYSPHVIIVGFFLLAL